MKRTHSLVIFFALVLTTLFVVYTNPAHAAFFLADKEISLDAQEQITDDVYIAGGSVSTSSSVSGDVMIAGGNVITSNEVLGDLTVVGGNLSLLSVVQDDLRAAGGTVLIGKSVGGDLVVAGGQVTVLSEVTVNGGVAIFAGQARINGALLQDGQIIAEDVVINGEVSGHLTIKTNQLTFGDAAIIRGDVEYTSPKEARISEGAEILGALNFTEKETISGVGGDGGFGSILGTTVIKLLVIIVSALILGLVFKRPTTRLVQTTLAPFWKMLLYGVVGVIVIPIIGILLLFTIIGIPLGILLLLSYILMSILSFVMASVVFGSWMYREIGKTGHLKVDTQRIIVGGVLLILLGFIPIIGNLFYLVFGIATFGALIDMLRRYLWNRRSL